MFTNIKKQATDKIVPFCDAFLANLQIDCNNNIFYEKLDISTLHGSTTAITKDYLADLYQQQFDENNDVNLQVIIVTKAAECGISSKTATLGLDDGLPANTFDFSQRLGRCGRAVRSADKLHDEFTCILTLKSFEELVCRIYNDELHCSKLVKKENDYQLGVAMLHFLIFPTNCYHVMLEECFQSPSEYLNFEPCSSTNDGMCSYCSGRHKNAFVNNVNKDSMIDAINVHCFNKGDCEPARLMPTINKMKPSMVNANDEITNAQSEGLTLRLVAKRITLLCFKKMQNKK